MEDEDARFYAENMRRIHEREKLLREHGFYEPTEEERREQLDRNLAIIEIEKGGGR